MHDFTPSNRTRALSLKRPSSLARLFTPFHFLLSERVVASQPYLFQIIGAHYCSSGALINHLDRGNEPRPSVDRDGGRVISDSLNVRAHLQPASARLTGQGEAISVNLE